MVNDFKVKVAIFCGRRHFLELLIPQILSEGVVDEVILCNNTRTEEDNNYLYDIVEKNEKLSILELPKGITRGGIGYKYFYKSLNEENTVYIKMDDDVLYIEKGGISKLVEFRINNPHFFLVTPIIVNNNLGGMIMQKNNKFCYNLTGAQWYQIHVDGKLGEAVHRWYIEKYLTTNVENLHCETEIIYNNHFSINMISWIGGSLTELNENDMLGDDEQMLSWNYPFNKGLQNCVYGGTICAHYAFGPQNEHLDSTTIFLEYKKLFALRLMSDKNLYDLHQALKSNNN